MDYTAHPDGGIAENSQEGATVPATEAQAEAPAEETKPETAAEAAPEVEVEADEASPAPEESEDGETSDAE
ncbi:MAG TPA: hypothetical protein VGI45_24855 [Terracidiphilus sp.]|jgi:hypothetical protein